MMGKFPIFASWAEAWNLWKNGQVAVLIPVLPHHHVEEDEDGGVVSISNDQGVLWIVGEEYPLYSWNPRAPVRVTAEELFAFPRYGGREYTGYIGSLPDGRTFPAGDVRQIPGWRTLFVRVADIRRRRRNGLSSAEVKTTVLRPQDIHRKIAEEYWWVLITK